MERFRGGAHIATGDQLERRPCRRAVERFQHANEQSVDAESNGFISMSLTPLPELPAFTEFVRFGLPLPSVVMHVTAPTCARDLLTQRHA